VWPLFPKFLIESLEKRLSEISWSDLGHSLQKGSVVKHLWEVKHSYYCNEGNYYANESVETYYKSFSDFLAEWGDADMDYNLLFRWDWDEGNEDGDDSFNGDHNYRNGKLSMFWMGQRKGKYIYSTIEVCRNDEDAVIEFLKPRLQHLMSLWEPLSSPQPIVPSPTNESP
jgi:hypothetical protein